MNRKIQIALLTTILMGTVPGFANVTVTQNVGQSATSWPAGALIQVGSNPSTQQTVGESFGSGVTSLAQTFTVPKGSNYLLQSAYLYVGTGTGTSASAPVTINLYDLGVVTTAPSTYPASDNLIGGGTGVSINYTVQSPGLLRLDFTGNDQIVFGAGHMYALELAGTSNTTPLYWYRTTSDLYSGGAAYRNRGFINGTSARDFSLALFAAATTAPATTAPTVIGVSTINGAVLHQKMDGFGAGAVFLDAGLDPLTDSQMDSLYGTGPGEIGLSIIRLRIDPNGNWADAIADGQKAHQRGAKILATPWTPPAALKTNDNAIGGSLMASAYGAYVDHLNSFSDAMAAGGAPVDVISLQNEPDANVTYESCSWTATQFLNFCRDNAGSIKVPVMMPESESWTHSYSDATLQDVTAASHVAYLGGHLYGATVQDYPLGRSSGKPMWMTEYLLNDQTIGSAVGTAAQISDTITIGNMSAYVWWKTIGTANGLLDANGVLQPRGYVFGQFSKFIRPGDYRIDVPTNTSPVSITAYKDSASGRFAIVAVNNTSSAKPVTFTINGVSVASVTPWITSSTKSLEQQSQVAVNGGVLSYTFPATSVVTLSGLDTPVAGTVQLVASTTLVKENDGSYQVTVLVKNSGTGTVQNLMLTAGSLGNAAATNLPQPLGNICPGCSNSTTLIIPAGAGASGTTVIGHYTGTYKGGTFGASLRTALP